MFSVILPILTTIKALIQYIRMNRFKKALNLSQDCKASMSRHFTFNY